MVRRLIQMVMLLVLVVAVAIVILAFAVRTFPQVKTGTWVQTVALMVTTVISVGAAYLGAKFGANATREATQRGIEFQQSAEIERHARVRRSLLLAFAAELRLNAETLRLAATDERKGEEAAARNAPLERQSADAALEVLYSLSVELQSEVLSARSRMFRYNQLIDLVVSFRTSNQVDALVRSKTHESLKAMWPDSDRYDGLAKEIESSI